MTRAGVQPGMQESAAHATADVADRHAQASAEVEVTTTGLLALGAMVAAILVVSAAIVYAARVDR